MDFQKVIRDVVGELAAAGVRYATIGGFAMALRGVQRATIDLDFILALEDLERADAILQRWGYVRAFRTQNVSHYFARDGDWGRIDLLHAFRAPSLGMLQRAESIEIAAGLSLRVAKVEDIIGLKIQALRNDPRRAGGDWQDILALLRTAGEQTVPIDWELVADYLTLFKMGEQLGELKSTYGEAAQN